MKIRKLQSFYGFGVFVIRCYILLSLSNRLAAKTPPAMKKTLISPEEMETAKLSKGIIITVAAMTIPIIA